MKFVIGNYSYNQSTESIYFYKLINSIPNFSCYLWDMSRKSAYDVLDENNPDFLIIMHNNLTLDVITYLANNKKINSVINASDIKQEELDHLSKLADQYKIPIKVLFTNKYNNQIKNKKYNLVYIGHGADIFLKNSPLSYVIDYGLFFNFPESLERTSFNEYKDSSYHVITNNKQIKNADICIPTFQLPDIISCYNTFMFKDIPTKSIPQTIFDAILYGNNIKIESVDEKILKTFKSDPNLMSKEELKNMVIEKHTCINRLKTLFSQLSIDNDVNKYLTEMIDNLKNQRII